MNSLPYKFEQVRSTATITFVNQKKNALTEAFFREFPKSIRSLSSEGKLTALILQAEGDWFSSGIDIALLKNPQLMNVSDADSRNRLMERVSQMQDCVKFLIEAPFPVIASINGPAIGAGFSLLAGCDFRYALKSAFFSIEETNRGLMADLGALQILAPQLSTARMAELAFLGSRLTAQKAVEWGFLNDVLDTAEELCQAVNATAAGLSSKSPLLLKQVKSAMRHARPNSLDQSLEYAALLQAAYLEPARVMKSFDSK